MASLADMLAQPREDQLILVDLMDRPQGSMGKLACHQQARLHRAFSLFLYREGGGALQLLLQRRARGKYHSGGLADAVPRRLTQELGVPASKATSLEYVEVGSFVYRSSFGNGLTEFEYDHVFVAPYDGPLAPDPSEVAATAWVDAREALADLQAHPSRYASWFLTAAPMACAWLAAHVCP